jgi:Tfp pilus assembly protein PilP
MRVAKFSRMLLLLALTGIPAACALAQEHPNVKPSAVRDQLRQQSPGAAQSQPARPAKAPATPNRPAPAQSGAMAKPPNSAIKAPAEKAAVQKASVQRRDPFETLLKSTAGSGPPQNLPPGKAGLMVGTLQIEGIVSGASGMIAIVSNPQQRVYFLKEGDKLYDGSIERITLEAITFHQFGKDAFGKPLEREVTKRLYPSPGE